MAALKKQTLIDAGVPQTDSDGDLSLFCAEFTTPHKNYRGVVFKGEDLLHQGFPYCVERSSGSDNSDIEFEKCRLFYAHEGTLIRVFHANDKWYTTTNRKLDAMKSKWAAKTETFGTSFAKAIMDMIDVDEEPTNEFLEKVYDDNLDPKKQYMFLLKHTREEMIVCMPAGYAILHVGTFTEDGFTLDDQVVFGKRPVCKSIEIDIEKTAEMVADFVEYNTFYLENQGILAIHEDGTHYKIFSKEYEMLFNVRGNTPSLRFRYLQIRSDPDMFYLFTERLYRHFDWRAVEEEISELCEVLQHKYYSIYIRKREEIPLTKTEGAVMGILHKLYLSTRIQTTVERVGDILANGTAVKLNRLLKEQADKKKSLE